MKKIRIDLTGKRFRRLYVISYSYTDEYKKARWNCHCDCGNNVIIRGDGIKSGHAKSCGCHKRKTASELSYKDLLGKRFGKLVVIEKTNRKGIGRQFYWKCKCDCGKTKVISGNSLRSGATKSCGCLLGKHLLRDGKCKSAYPKIWGRKLRTFIRNLDDHICRFPNCSYSDLENVRRLHVHHIDGDKRNCETYNLISLCGSHHKYIESTNPKKWKQYFYSLTIGENFERYSLCAHTQ